jgi:hypothetical protein
MRHIILASLGAMLLVPALEAQGRKPGLYEKFQVDLSITTLIINSDIRVDRDGGPGTDVDAEDDLGVSTLKIQPRVSLRWRPGRRHEVEVGYQFVRRSGEKVIDREIEIGDSVFEAETLLSTTYNTDQAFLAYRFAFLAKERTQVGLGIGLGALFVDVGLDAPEDNGGRRADARVNAPVGSVGLYSRFLSGERWYFELDARYIEATIDRYNPMVVEWNAAARYLLSERFELEAGYGGSAIEVNIDPEAGTGLGDFGPGGRIKYGLQHFRFGVVWTP